MGARRLKAWLVVPPAIALLLGGLIGFALNPGREPGEPGGRAVEDLAAPDPVVIADAALLSVRDQGRLTSFSGRFVAVVTASETRLGLTASKTLIMPGTVRYGVDVSRLRREDLDWDAPTRTLAVTLPPLEMSGPEIDFGEVRETSEGGLVMALTDAERTLDQANRRSAREELMRQARDRIPTELARNAAMRMVARSFAMPLRAAGIDASVSVRFLDPAGREEASFLDRPRRIEEAVQDRRAGAAPSPPTGN